MEKIVIIKMIKVIIKKLLQTIKNSKNVIKYKKIERPKKKTGFQLFFFFEKDT